MVGNDLMLGDILFELFLVEEFIGFQKKIASIERAYFRKCKLAIKGIVVGGFSI